MLESELPRRSFLAAASLAAYLAAPSRSLRGAEVAGALQPDPPRPLAPSQADLGTLYPTLSHMADALRRTVADKPERFDDVTRKRWRGLIQSALRYELPTNPLRARTLERVDCGDYVRERVIYESAPWFQTPAYLLIPKRLDAPAPAIVDLHSHGGMFLFGKEKVIDLGMNHPVMVDYHQKNYGGRPTASELARRGYVVLSADTFMFGERRILMDEDLRHGWDRAAYSVELAQQLNAKCRAKESTLAKSLAFVGTTWPGIVNGDDRRAVDYLVSRPEVDAKRIGCVGISMGGYRSLYLAALDERIAAACVVGFMSTTPPMLRAHIDTHSWVHFLPGLHPELDWPEVAALASPRALFVQQCSQDRLFPLDGMRASLERIAAWYTAAECRNQFRGEFYDAPHQWTIPMQDEAFAWLDEKLQHAPRSTVRPR